MRAGRAAALGLVLACAPACRQGAAKGAPDAALPAGVLAAPDAPSEPPVGWVDYAGDDFQVHLPAAATRSVLKNPTDEGEATTVLYALNHAEGYFAVSVTHYPKGALKAEPAQVLAHAQAQALGNVAAKPDTSAEVSFAARGKRWPGREFEGATPQGLRLHARLYLVEDRLYQLIYVHEGRKWGASDFRLFAGSMRLKE